jgi:hypothetical protein
MHASPSTHVAPSSSRRRPAGFARCRETVRSHTSRPRFGTNLSHGGDWRRILDSAARRSENVGFLIVHADTIQFLTGFATQPFDGSGRAFNVERRKNGRLIISRGFGFSPTVASARRRQNDASTLNYAVNGAATTLVND